MRYFLVGLTLVFASVLNLAVGEARAYDIAKRHIIGFSADGSKFAFEEYGTTEEENGAVYVNLYVIDTRTDQWLPGTPIRHKEQWVPDTASEDVVIAKARSHAAEKAKNVLRDISVPGDVMASNPITEASADPYKAVFCTCPNDPSTSELILEELPLPATTLSSDPDWNEEAKGNTRGFRLTLKNSAGSKILHEDKDLPKSRGQALGYRIVDAAMHGNDKGYALAVLLMVFERGAEGQDGRYIAVTAQISSP